MLGETNIDIFMSHSHKDKDWVLGWLVPRSITYARHPRRVLGSCRRLAWQLLPLMSSRHLTVRQDARNARRLIIF